MSTPAPTGPIVSLQAHILNQQASFPEATGTLSWILSALSISAKIIAAKVRRARLEEQAGGKALAAPGQRILDVQPTDIHQRVPVVLGSAAEVDRVMAHL